MKYGVKLLSWLQKWFEATWTLGVPNSVQKLPKKFQKYILIEEVKSSEEQTLLGKADFRKYAFWPVLDQKLENFKEDFLKIELFLLVSIALTWSLRTSLTF